MNLTRQYGGRREGYAATSGGGSSRRSAGAAVTRRNGGYVDSGGGRFGVSPSILARVFSAGGSFWRDSNVVVPAFGSAVAAVLPLAAVTGSARVTLVGLWGVYPFCHLFFRCLTPRHEVSKVIINDKGDNE